MARQIYAFSVVVPTGATKASPNVQALTLPSMPVAWVRVRVPPGPSGQLGFVLAVGGQQIIPYQVGTWIVADNEVFNETLDGFPDSGGWSIMAYNTGAYAHTLQVTFGLAQQSQAIATPQQPIPPDVLAELTIPTVPVFVAELSKA